MSSINDNTSDAFFDQRGRWKEPVNIWENTIEDQVGARQLLQIVQAQMETLPHNFKQIILLREVYKFETAEICNTLNITPVHSRVMLHRARQALYEAVNRYLRKNSQGSAISQSIPSISTPLFNSHTKKR